MFFQGVHHHAHHGVGLDNEVPVVTGFRFPVIFFIGNDRVVRRIESKIGKKGLILFLLRNPFNRFLGDGGQDVVGVPAFGHRSRPEAAAPREGPGLDYWLGWNGNEAVPFDPTVGREVDCAVPEIIIKTLIKRTVRKWLGPVIGLGMWISFFGARFTNRIKVPT